MMMMMMIMILSLVQCHKEERSLEDTWQ